MGGRLDLKNIYIREYHICIYMYKINIHYKVMLTIVLPTKTMALLFYTSLIEIHSKVSLLVVIFNVSLLYMRRSAVPRSHFADSA